MGRGRDGGKRKEVEQEAGQVRRKSQGGAVGAGAGMCRFFSQEARARVGLGAECCPRSSVLGGCLTSDLSLSLSHVPLLFEGRCPPLAIARSAPLAAPGAVASVACPSRHRRAEARHVLLRKFALAFVLKGSDKPTLGERAVFVAASPKS